jgi:hypothetical protein
MIFATPNTSIVKMGVNTTKDNLLGPKKLGMAFSCMERIAAASVIGETTYCG